MKTLTKIYKKSIIYLFITFMLFTSNSLFNFANADHDEVSRIGVLAYRGKENAINRWSATANYLTETVGHKFEIVPVNLEELAKVIQDGHIQFTLTNPGHYVNLESQFGVSRIATMQTRERGHTLVRYGAVIVTRSDNTDIKTLHDLKGKSFMAINKRAFGGFQMAWRELVAHDINPFDDFSELLFSGFPQDLAIMAVQKGEVDAATVRAETFANMVESGRISRDDFRILNTTKHTGNPFPVSTRLYPEWPFATLRDTPRPLATKVAQALLSMNENHHAAKAAHTAGWTIPLDYSPVHELMRTLQIGPYEVLRQTSIAAIMKRYSWWLIATASVVFMLILFNGYISRTNLKLMDTEKNLRTEITERKKSQAALSSYKDTLEEQVTDRTHDLKTTNMALEKSRVALRELVRISSAPDLSHDEKMKRLLDTGRSYYGLPVAVLTSVEEDKSHKLCKISGNGSLIDNQGPINVNCAEQLIDRQGEPLDIPDVANSNVSESLNQIWKSYLGAAVLVDSTIHCTLEFAGIEKRHIEFSKWDHEFLKVMAQWIGDEIEKQLAYEAQLRHQYEFARVTRMSTIGEMAASLAHELNQPLTGAINYSSGCLRLLRDGDTDKEKLITGLERTVESATLAADIIRHIREFVQKGDTEHSAVDMNSAFKNASSIVMPEVRQHNVVLKLELEDELPNILGDMIQLEQVVLNLIRNGVDAMESVESADRIMIVKSELSENKVLVSVSDTGEGLTEKSLSEIFNAFYTTKNEGMGIGLSISRSIVEAHGGTISAKTLARGGALFSFQIPVMGEA